MCERLTAFQTQQRQLDFASVKQACPKGIYFAPTPRDPNVWQGVLFVRKGPYASAILKFNILLSVSSRPPVITISTDVFHPLVTPLTTYTYTNSDTGADTVSATDADRLPPGGFSLRHGFPEWFSLRNVRSEEEESAMSRQAAQSGQASEEAESSEQSTSRRTSASSPTQARCGAVDIARVLYYMRSAFDSVELLDQVPLEVAANSGAWHAWQAHRAKTSGDKASGNRPGRLEGASSPSSMAQQPGGARRPGQWNWEGVWEERVRKSINASISQGALYGIGQESDLIHFLNIDIDQVAQEHIWGDQTNVKADLVPAAIET
ncbi:hypothetical protein AAFC00_004192 [Neodothiora populina]